MQKRTKHEGRRHSIPIIRFFRKGKRKTFKDLDLMPRGEIIDTPLEQGQFILSYGTYRKKGHKRTELLEVYRIELRGKCCFAKISGSQRSNPQETIDSRVGYLERDVAVGGWMFFAGEIPTSHVSVRGLDSRIKLRTWRRELLQAKIELRKQMIRERNAKLYC